MIQPFDLTPPTKSLAVAMMEPHPCRVCGQTRPGMSPLVRGAGAHDSCDRQVKRWFAEAERIRAAHPGYLCAEEAIAAAETERDRIYRDAMVAAGLPEWFADNRVSDLYEP